MTEFWFFYGGWFSSLVSNLNFEDIKVILKRFIRERVKCKEEILIFLGYCCTAFLKRAMVYTQTPPKFQEYFLLFIRVTLSFNWSWLLVGSRLFCLQNLPYLVSFRCMCWRSCGGLNKEHSISVHWGSNSFYPILYILISPSLVSRLINASSAPGGQIWVWVIWGCAEELADNYGGLLSRETWKEVP